MQDNKYIKIIIVVAAVLLVAIILVVALTQDKDQYPNTGEDYSTPRQEDITTTPAVTEGTIPEQTTNDQFDDSNIGQWLPVS